MILHKGFFECHREIKTAFHILVIIGVTVFVVLCGMISKGFNEKGEKNLDYVIVLGAQMRENGPSAVLKYRLDAAIRYLNDNPDTICIVSGGQGPNEPYPEAEGMYHYLMENGIQKERILMESKSENTIENMKYSKAIMNKNYESVGIITNNFHMFRALQIAKKQGLKNVCGISADSNKLYIPNNVLRECGAIMKGWIFNHEK